MCLLEGYSKDLNEYAGRADSLFNEGAYQEASIEFERLAYQATSNTERTIAIVRKSDCLVALSNFHSAKSNLLRINYFSLNDSIVFEARFKTAYSAYLDEDFSLANNQMFLIRQYLPEIYHRKSTTLYALSLNEDRSWTEAHELLIADLAKRSIPQHEKDSIIQELNSAYNEKDFPKYRDPEKAKNLSSVLPGLGQLYAGYPQDAAFTWFFLAAGLATGAYTAFVFRYFVTGLSIWGGIGERLYSGGVRRSAFLAEKKNYNTARRYNDSLKMLILQLNY